MDALAANIRRARKDAGLTQAELAERLGIQQSAIAHWEAGNTRPSTERLAQLAGALGTTVDRIVATSDDGEPPTTGCFIPILTHSDTGEGASTQTCIPLSVAADHPHALAFPVTDDSMDLVALHGMVAICDPDLVPRNGNTVVVAIGDDGPIMRRWYQGGDTIMLVAESHEAHRDIILPADDDFRVIGTVVWIQSGKPLV